MTEQWIKWEPIKGLSTRYYTDSISKFPKGLKIILSEENDRSKKVNIIFENSICAYRSTNESFTLQILDTLGEKYGKNFYAHWTFFKIINSSYIQWILQESHHVTNTMPLTHFAIFTLDSLIDIVATYEPKIELIQQNQ